MAGDTRISDDLWYELADAARATAASNRPRSLLILATVLFVIAGVALIVTLRERDRATRLYQLQTERKVTVEGLEKQFEALARLNNSTSNRANEPIEDLYSRIEVAATDAGLATKPTIPQPIRQPIQGAIKVTYRYKMQDSSLESLLAWIMGAADAVPGLQITALELTPTPRNWSMEVTFVRWERAS